MRPVPDLVDAGGDRVGRDTGRGAQRQRGADQIDPPLDAEAGHVGEPVVERRHVVPEADLRAAQARVARADGPVGAAVPLENRAWGKSARALAADLVETPATPGRVVVEILDVLAGIEVSPPGALVVNPAAVSESRPPHRIHRRE